jgi:hypothetical protein
MRTVSFYKWSAKIAITAYCDQYAVSAENVLYFISLVGPDSAVRGIIAAIHTGESIRIRGDGEYVDCQKGIAPLKSFTTKLGYENFTHGVCVDTSAWEIDQRSELLILKNTQAAIYVLLHKNFAITAIPEWQAWLHKRVSEFIIPLHCYGLEAFLLKLTEAQLDEIIAAGCVSGELRFSKHPVSGDSALATIDGVEAYLQKFGGELAEKIHTTFRPLYLPEKQQWHSRIHSLLRTPFQAQGDAVMGAVETLKTQKSLNIVGEMGVGKTLLGAVIPYVYAHAPCRTLIVCPGHLVQKWADEIKRTIPNSRTLIVRKYTDLMPLLPLRKTRPQCYEYYIISKDKAKLSYFWKSAVLVKGNTCSCPQCGVKFQDKEGWLLPVSYFEQSRRYCSACKSPLWEADGSKLRRFAPAEFIKQCFKRFFTFLICDEVHELKGSDTAQGNVLGMLASCVEKTVTLTGTLLSGYADDLFYIIYRTNPKIMKHENFLWGETQKWLEHYDVLERVTKVQKDGEDNVASRGSKKRENVRRRPGVSPLVYSKFLLGNTVFLQLDDISEQLPSITENVVGVKMNTELANAYNLLEQTIGKRVREEMAATGNSTLLGTYLLSLLAYTDRPYQFGPILHPSAKKALPPEYFLLAEKEKFLMANPNLIAPEDIIVIPPDLPETAVYPKEKMLLEIVEQEIAQHRRCFIYCVFTNMRDVTSRIESLLTKQNIKTITLKSSVLPETRIDWVAEKVKQGYEVIICNPELVKTGLDLLDFPTLIFYQTGYSTFTLRQASRRSWRIGQTKEVKIFYLFYQATMQEQALKLMAAKLEASIGIEGKFSEEGLIAMSSGDDMMNALAKAIVGKIGNTDSAENIWKRMAEKTRSSNTGSTKEHALSSVEIATPSPESPCYDQEQTIVVEIVKLQGKRRIIERVEGREKDVRKILQNANANAQLLFF